MSELGVYLCVAMFVVTVSVSLVSCQNHQQCSDQVIKIQSVWHKCDGEGGGSVKSTDEMVFGHQQQQ